VNKRIYQIIELTKRKTTIVTTIRALRNKKQKLVYRYIPVLNPLPYKVGQKVKVTIEPLD